MNSQTLEKKALWQLRESLQVVWRLSELNPKPPIFEDQTWIAKAHRTSCSQFGQFSDWIHDLEEVVLTVTA
jgi:hypothetical protein